MCLFLRLMIDFVVELVGMIRYVLLLMLFGMIRCVCVFDVLMIIDGGLL